MKSYIVDTASLRNNLEKLTAKAGQTPIWAVLKGDGYGLGVVHMADLCREAGISRFAVTELAEVQALRTAGYEKEEILMLRPTADTDEVHTLLDLGAIFTVSSQDDATLLNGIATQRGVVAEAHIKIDTGMGRYGFLPTELDKLIPIYAYMDGIAVTGIYTHFHSAFCSKKHTYSQFAQFHSVIKAINDAGYETGMAHCCNSSAFLKYPDLWMDGVRIGSAILGRLSFKGSYALKRVGYCEATVEELRWLPKGHTCGYGAGWKAKRPTRIAVLPVGWYHGFGCEMGNDLFRPRDSLRKILSAIKSALLRKSFYVAINGERCRVLGHIGMLHTVVDVTSVTCALGDKAILDINPLMQKGMPVVYR